MKADKFFSLQARRVRQTTLLLFISFFYGAFAQAHLPLGVAVSIEPIKTNYDASDALMVEIRYTNVSDLPIRFLMRGTALEKQINEDFLEISSQGRLLPYVGRHVKRLPPTESEYISIEPDQSVSATVDIGEAYPMFEKGQYHIVYKGASFSSGDASLKSSSVASIELSEDRAVKLLKRRTPIIDASCSSTQRSQINQALAIAENIARSARDALNNAPVELRPTARRYTEWFGAYSPGRYSTAQTAFNRISSALSNQVIGFDCTCDINNRENVFAFVFANDPYNMNVCPVFFRVAPSGTDSRSGTIIHEISHFNVVIGSDDFSSALNQSGSRRLAQSNPSAAIRNANAFEYFAENTPFLPMPTVDDLPRPSDLVVSSFSVQKQNPAVEELVGVSAVIANVGESESPSTQASIRLSPDAVISLNDTQLSQGVIPLLGSGAMFNFDSAVQAPSEPGEYWIGICVSPVVGELVTTNNCSGSVPLMVRPRATFLPSIFLLLLDETSD